jgi:2-keto-3-deoxy-6-phosphogluconate aldolase
VKSWELLISGELGAQWDSTSAKYIVSPSIQEKMIQLGEKYCIPTEFSIPMK